MARAVAEIEREIRSLKPGDQERLLRALVEELDGPPDPGVEQAWLEEAQRRSHEIDAGAVTAIPAEEVLTKARAELKRR
jgi:putative addiction module component (TIGR02574 family)